MATDDEVKRVSAGTFLPAVVVSAVASTVWFAFNQQRPYGPLALGWIAAPVTLTLATAALRCAALSPGLPAAARYFWNRLAVVTAVCALGTVIEAGYTVTGRASDATAVPAPAAVCFVGAVLYGLWALLRLPAGARTPGEWVRLSLDCATVVLGAAVFLWYVGFGPLPAGGGPPARWALAVGVAGLFGVAAICKVVLVGVGPVDPGALRLLGFGLLAGGVTAGTATVIAGQPHLVAGQISVPYISVLAVLAAERQQRAFAGERVAYRPRHPHALNPLLYGAVAATDALLILVTMGRVDDRRYVVVGGAITITVLVVVRQMVAFADNARLADRLRHQEDRLRHQASHDELTRLANRAFFADRLRSALGSGPGAGGGVTVLLIDLDDFKSVNDTLGHSVGDRLLAVVADRVRRCLRPGDTVARLGGDEFAVLLRHARPPTVDAVTENILASLRRPVVVPGHELLAQASIGVSEAGPGDDPEALLRKADIAMYAAKEGGKDNFARYVPGMGAGILEQAELGAQLRQAIDDGQLRLLYQPVVRFSDGRIIGMEALVRWRHPSRGEIPPADFIPTAERTGLIVPLGRWVLREACRQKAAWRAAYGDTSPATIGVNVSGRQLQEPGFVDEVADAVHENGLEPHQLVLEVIETAVLTGGRALDTLHALRDFGVSLALDDFGTGQSSLGLIRTCPVHILKLDKSFVIGGGTGPGVRQQAAIASAVLHMADDLGLDAVAEGIEDQEQADRMSALGYRLGQGYHLVRPLPPDEIAGLLAGDRAPLP